MRLECRFKNMNGSTAIRQGPSLNPIMTSVMIYELFWTNGPGKVDEFAFIREEEEEKRENLIEQNPFELEIYFQLKVKV